MPLAFLKNSYVCKWCGEREWEREGDRERKVDFTIKFIFFVGGENFIMRPLKHENNGGKFNQMLELIMAPIGNDFFFSYWILFDIEQFWES